MILYFQKRLSFIIIILCLIVIIPYFITCFYIHPFFDDYIFSTKITADGWFSFARYFYLNWSGRYTELSLMGIFSANIYETNSQYFVVALFILVTLLISFFYLMKVILEEFITLSWIWIVTFIAFAFYLSFLPELFTAFYWNCSSYYQLCLAFLLFDISLIVNYFKNKSNWKNKFLLIIVNIFVAGFSEISVISFGILFFSILLYQYYKRKKIDSFLLILFLVFLLCSSFNFASPGNFARISVSDSNNGFVFSSLRAVYDLIVFHFTYTFFKTPFLLLVVVSFPFLNKITHSNKSLLTIFNVHPFYVLLVTILIFYLHHALSVYGAGYSLQGRTFNFSILLFWIACFYNILVLMSFVKKEFNLVPINFLNITSNFFVVLILLLLNFSDNNRLLYGDLVRELPLFQKQLISRYALIREAKKEGKFEINVPLVKASPKLYMLGESARCSKYSFTNDEKFLKEQSLYFNIDIKLQEP